MVYKSLSKAEWVEIADQYYRVEKEMEKFLKLLGARVPVKVGDALVKARKQYGIVEILLEDKMCRDTQSSLTSDERYYIFNRQRFDNEIS